jgi:ATP-grasp domain
MLAAIAIHRMLNDRTKGRKKVTTFLTPPIFSKPHLPPNKFIFAKAVGWLMMPLVFQTKQVTREIQDLVSKTEAGGVRLNLHDGAAMRQAVNDIQAQLAGENKLDAMDEVIAEPMISAGVELIAGVIGDPLFGPLVAFGLGGIHVEILKDVCFRITPLTDGECVKWFGAYAGTAS